MEIFILVVNLMIVGLIWYRLNKKIEDERKARDRWLRFMKIDKGSKKWLGK